MVRHTLFVAAVLLGLTAAFAAAQDSAIFFVPEPTPTPAPAFKLPDLTGQTVPSTVFGGKIAVLSFGATWCPTCTSELKSLENLQARFPKDLVVYFVALDGRGEKEVKPYMDKHGHRVPTLVDPRMAVAQEYGIRWIPVTVIVDRQGTIVGRAIGPREWDGKEALELVQSLLKR
jgi:peroxiredoxin